MNPDLPEFYHDKITYHCVERYNDYENRDNEIVEDINHKLSNAHDDTAAAAAVEFKEEKSSDDDEFKEGGVMDKLKFW